MLAVHLLNHEGTPEEAEESEVGHIDRHLRWDPLLAHRVLAYSQSRRLVTRKGNQLRLTALGRETARDGERVVALLPNGETTLKTFYRESDHIRLQPANPEFAPITVQECTVQGVVVGVLRRYG